MYPIRNQRKHAVEYHFEIKENTQSDHVQSQRKHTQGIPFAESKKTQLEVSIQYKKMSKCTPYGIKESTLWSTTSKSKKTPKVTMYRVKGNTHKEYHLQSQRKHNSRYQFNIKKCQNVPHTESKKARCGVPLRNQRKHPK